MDRKRKREIDRDVDDSKGNQNSNEIVNMRKDFKTEILSIDVRTA